MKRVSFTVLFCIHMLFSCTKAGLDEIHVPARPQEPIKEIVTAAPKGKLFIPGGVYEYDLIEPQNSPDGKWHLFFDYRLVEQDVYSWLGTGYKTAATFEGLADAPVTKIKEYLRYPTVRYEDGQWHLWGMNFHHTGTTQHYKGATITELVNSPLLNHTDNGIDCHVRKNKSEPGWLMGAKTNVGGIAITFTTTHLDSNFANMVFALYPSPGTFYSEEIADCAPFYKGDRLFMLFAGFNGTVQSLGIMELDPVTRELIPGTVKQILAPTEAWQGNKIFNPMHSDAYPDRVYYSTQKGTDEAPQDGELAYFEYIIH